MRGESATQVLYPVRRPYTTSLRNLLFHINLPHKSESPYHCAKDDCLGK